MPNIAPFCKVFSTVSNKDGLWIYCHPKFQFPLQKKLNFLSHCASKISLLLLMSTALNHAVRIRQNRGFVYMISGWSCWCQGECSGELEVTQIHMHMQATLNVALYNTLYWYWFQWKPVKSGGLEMSIDYRKLRIYVYTVFPFPYGTSATLNNMCVQLWLSWQGMCWG